MLGFVAYKYDYIQLYMIQNYLIISTYRSYVFRGKLDAPSVGGMVS